LSFSDAFLTSLVADGVDAATIVRAIIADRAAAKARRAAAKAARESAREVGQESGFASGVESGVESGFATIAPGHFAAADPVASVPAATGGVDKHRARRALLLATGLAPLARQVGARLVEHCNLETGLCCPALTTIARDLGLFGRDPLRSVRRAVAQLEAAGVLRRVLHGAGRSNRFIISWDVLARLDGEVTAATRRGATIVANPDSQAAHRTIRSANPDSGVRQNIEIKQSPSVPQERVVRARPRRTPDRRQGSLLFPIKGGADRAAAAEGQAEKRVWEAMHRTFGASETALALVLGLDGAVFDTAHREERDRPGAGIGVIERALKAAG
jgi:hypothetical protein